MPSSLLLYNNETKALACVSSLYEADGSYWYLEVQYSTKVLQVFH